MNSILQQLLDSERVYLCVCVCVCLFINKIWIELQQLLDSERVYDMGKKELSIENLKFDLFTCLIWSAY
jgi:hypothetical protein